MENEKKLSEAAALRVLGEPFWESIHKQKMVADAAKDAANEHILTAAALSAFLKKTKQTQSKVAKELNVSNTLLSQFLKGVYKGDNAAMSYAVNSYLSVAQMRLAVKENTFYPDLNNTKEVMKVALYCATTNDIALLSGDAGAGKTTALRHYAKNNPATVMITADISCTTSTPTPILRRICEALNIPAPRSRGELMTQIIGKLKDTNRLLIIDEADRLRLCSLQAIRDIHEAARVGILLAGNDKLYNDMVTARNCRDFDQIRTRLTCRPRIFNNFSPQELQILFPLLDDTAAAEAVEITQWESLRGFRKIYNFALECSEQVKKPLTKTLLKDVYNHLCGYTC